MKQDSTTSSANYSSLDNTPVVDAVIVSDDPLHHRTSTQARRVEVTAPANLVGGYELHVDMNGRNLVVQVPDDGVKQGQTFLATVLREEPVGGGSHRIPHGHWRDGICNWAAHGICHPVCCLAWCCTPIALGQVMTRMKLNAAAAPAVVRQAFWSAFKVLALIFLIYVALDNALSVVLEPYIAVEVDENGNVTQPDMKTFPTWVLVMLAFRALIRTLFFFYMLFVMIRTRAHIRAKYAIPENSCQGCEDCCCAFWLPCCTVSQMARHTADYNTYHSACCSETGLPENVPHVV